MELAPHRYLLRVRDHLREREPGRWRWFASDEATREYLEAARLELLQSTYRMEPASHPALYAIGARALSALSLDVPLTFYQASTGAGLNAGLLFVPGEAHVVLQGPVLATMNDEQLAALIGHELAHHRLASAEDGSLRVASNVLESIVARRDASPSHVVTAGRMRRYAEIYADRGALLVATDLLQAIACLVKVHTGLLEVDPAAYLRQAEEVVAKSKVSERQSHPEMYVRAKALALFHERGLAAEDEIAAMVQGPRTMDTLDLLDQVELTDVTRRVLLGLLEPPWMRSEAVLAHARAYFADIDLPTAPARVSAAAMDVTVQEYLAYVLLDFAVVDPSLGEAALAHAIRSAAALGVADVFDRVARDELKLSKKAFEELCKKAPTLVERAAAQAAEA
jgi:hypothetical protein